uniref:Uncharacterized protein n=1 Tax=Triticum urartu TaxID=4572 RepID=A0A8R7UGD2_TRIUA
MLGELWKADSASQLRALGMMWEWWDVRKKANIGEPVSSPQRKWRSQDSSIGGAELLVASTKIVDRWGGGGGGAGPCSSPPGSAPAQR